MTRKVLFCDVDGVCADFSAYLLRTLNASLSASEVTQWNILDLLLPHEKLRALEILKDPKWWANQPTVYKAQRSIEELRQNNWDIVFVTSPWTTCREWSHVRTEWLVKNMDATKDAVIVTARKDYFHGDAFLDDKTDHVEAVVAKGLIPNAMLFDAPYNKDAKVQLRMDNWDAVNRWLLGSK